MKGWKGENKNCENPKKVENRREMIFTKALARVEIFIYDIDFPCLNPYIVFITTQSTNWK